MGNVVHLLMQPRHQSYFYHSRKERNALVLLLTLCFICSSLPRLYIWHYENDAFSNLYAPEVKEWIKLAPERKYPASGHFDSTSHSARDLPSIEKFSFDPNTASLGDLQRLGLSEKQASVIINYRQKGGRFRQPADIHKIWGISPALADNLEPFIHIKEREQAGIVAEKRQQWAPAQVKTVNINTADSLQFLSLPGIGPGFTSRIMKFRGRLGGFISVNQISEVYGLPDSVFQKIKPHLKCEGGMVKRININLANLDELGRHPYIRYPLAKLIVAYREQHGQFSGIEVLQKIMVLDDSTFNRFKPYISVD